MSNDALLATLIGLLAGAAIMVAGYLVGTWSGRASVEEINRHAEAMGYAQRGQISCNADGGITMSNFDLMLKRELNWTREMQAAANEACKDRRDENN